MSEAAPLSDEVTERIISVSTLMDANVEAVFNAWTDPDLLPQWWGPNGFTVTTDSIDIRPGGEWRFVMHGPDGTDYKNHIVFDEIQTPNRIAYTHKSGPIFSAVATFDAEGEKTLVTLRMLFETAELRNRVEQEFNAVEGGNQTLARLEQLIKNQ